MLSRAVVITWLGTIKEKAKKYVNELGWSKLRAWGHNSIIKSSYIWLIIVPLAAKMLQALPEQHTFIIFETCITVHFGLTFSWIAFYFMALFFAIGQFIYKLKCPEILKNYANFSDYEKSGGGNLLILNWLEKRCGNFFGDSNNDISLKKLKEDIQDLRLGNSFVRCCADDKPKILEEQDILDKKLIAIIFKETFCNSRKNNLNDFNDWFYAISNSYEKVDFFWLKTSAICFALGFLFFIVVAIQNLWFVIKAIF